MTKFEIVDKDTAKNLKSIFEKTQKELDGGKLQVSA
jgi:hypothetical protein